MLTTVVAPIRAEHEDAIQFNKELTCLALKRARVVSELELAAKKLKAAMSVVFVFRIVDASTEAFLPAEARDADAIRVVRVWKNKDEFDAVSRRYGFTVISIKETTVSPIYYRINGVLVKVGSGVDVLQTNSRVVSDDEWKQLKHGHIHERLLKSAA